MPELSDKAFAIMDARIVEFVDTVMSIHNGVSVLLLEKECIVRFGEKINNEHRYG